MVACIAPAPTPKSRAALDRAGANMCMPRVPLSVSSASSQSGGARLSFVAGCGVLGSTKGLFISVSALVVENAANMLEHPSGDGDVRVGDVGKRLMAGLSGDAFDAGDRFLTQHGQHDRLGPAILLLAALHETSR